MWQTTLKLSGLIKIRWPYAVKIKQQPLKQVGASQKKLLRLLFSKKKAIPLLSLPMNIPARQH